MNPQLHDEFVALAALFYAGELDDEEWALLQVHMAYCDSCRLHFEQYEHITSNVMPAMAAGLATDVVYASMESSAAFEAAERRLMDRLNSVRNHQAVASPRIIPWKTISSVLAACVVGITALIGAYHLGVVREAAKSAVPALPMPAAPAPTGTSQPDATMQASLDSAQKQIEVLHQQLSATQDRASQSSVAVVSAEHQLQTEQAQRDQVSAERDALNQQLASVQAEVQSMRDQSAAITTGAAKQAAQVDALQNKINLLNVALIEKDKSLNDKDRMLAVDKDFLAHDRDIRDVIGARNLYIADIIDMGANGKTAKPFGRIFYTKDSSLIFYGFDLDKQPGLEQSAAFQVWGSGSDKHTVSLGMFYQDDSHKRWVLRCNDPKTLARLNMVFVTVEPPGGSSKPTGKQLLRAYLQIQPNHP